MKLWPRRRAWWTALFALLIGLAGAPLAFAAPVADVDGNTYTSPQFGFTWTWDDSWFLVNEDSDPALGDSIEITNGVTTALIIAGSDFGDDPAFTLEILYRSFGRQEGVSSVTRVEDSQVLEEGRASEVFVIAFDETAGAQAQEITIYLDIRLMGPDQPVAIFEAFTTTERFPREWPAIEKLLNGWSVVSGEPVTNGGTAVPTEETPTGQIEEVPGEPAPVFVVGQWRVAVRAAALDATLPDVGLRREDDSEWLVVVADVSNWSDEDGTFAAEDFSVGIAGEDPVEPSDDETAEVADELGVGPDPDSLEQEIGAGETARVVLVFLLPEGSEGLVLQSGDEGLPLDAVLDDDLSGDDLPEEVAAPTVVTGQIVSSSDGRTVRIRIEGSTASSRVRLLGVALLAEGECFAGEAASLLESLEGTQVLIERDESTGETGSLRYVWLINEDGTRTLLNVQVIRQGLATAEDLADDVRFSAWLLESQRRAEAEPAGLWAECGQPDGDGGGDAGADEEDAADATATSDADHDADGEAEVETRPGGPTDQIGPRGTRTPTPEAEESPTPEA
jgi:hypothetical protein